VGGYLTSGGGRALIEQYTGSGWDIVPSPSLPGSDAGGQFNTLGACFDGAACGVDLDAVSCVSASQCWAVGGYLNASSTDEPPLIEQSTPSGWSRDAVVQPGIASAQLLGVACVRADDCWAVGDDLDVSTNEQVPLIERYTGSGWSVVPGPPSPDGAATQLSSVAV
jgi:hypothetical protein